MLSSGRMGRSGNHMAKKKALEDKLLQLQVREGHSGSLPSSLEMPLEQKCPCI